MFLDNPLCFTVKHIINLYTRGCQEQHSDVVEVLGGMQLNDVMESNFLRFYFILPHILIISSLFRYYGAKPHAPSKLIVR